MPGPFSFWLLPGVIFHRHHAIFVLCEDNKWPNRYQQTAGGVGTDRGWKRGPKCCWINWCSLSLTPRLSPPFQTCTTNTFNASNASCVRGGGLIETDRCKEWEICTRYYQYGLCLTWEGVHWPDYCDIIYISMQSLHKHITIFRHTSLWFGESLIHTFQCYVSVQSLV